MINLRKIRISLILATTFLSASSSLLYAMDDQKQITTLPVALKVEPVTPGEDDDPNHAFALHVSISQVDTIFSPLSSEDAILTIEEVLNSHRKLSGDDIPSLEVKRDGNNLFCFKSENGLTLIDATEAQQKLNAMLLMCNNAVRQEPEEDLTAAKHIALEEYHNSLAPEPAASEDQETLGRNIQESTKRKEERDNELARLRALLATKEAEAVAAEKDRQQKEEAARLQFEEDRMKMQKMFAETQAALVRQQQEIAAQAELLRQRQAAEAQRQAEQAETQRQATAAPAPQPQNIPITKEEYEFLKQQGAQNISVIWGEKTWYSKEKHGKPMSEGRYQSRTKKGKKVYPHTEKIPTAYFKTV